MLDGVFASARRARGAAFVPFVVAGDPDLDTTERVLAELTRAGAGVIELGVPYGDPLADGPTIAAAAQRALASGVSLQAVLTLVARARASGSAPILLFTYFNPVYQYGIARFAADAAAAGAAGAIVPDVALEEVDELRDALLANGLSMPLLIAPSTPLPRAARIAEASTGFVYVVSRLGVTGAGSAPNFEPVRWHLRALRGITEKPLAVGFGVSTPEHVREIAPFADGIIVGSALIDAYSGKTGEAAARSVAEFVTPLVAAAGGK